MDLILIVFCFSTSNFGIIQKAHLLLDTTQWVTTFSTKTLFFSLKNSSLTLTHRYVVYLNSEKRHTYCKYTNTEQNACRHYPQWLFMCVLLLLFFLLVLTFVEGSICSSMIKLSKFCGCHCICPYSSGISFETLVLCIALHSSILTVATFSFSRLTHLLSWKQTRQNILHIASL